MKTWTTKDGRKIPIREMTDSHLENTIRFLRRAFEAYRDDVAMNPPAF